MKPKKSLHDRPVTDDFYNKQGLRCIAYHAGKVKLCEKRNISGRIEAYTNPKIYLLVITADADEINLKDWITPDFQRTIVEKLTTKFDIGAVEVGSLSWADPCDQHEDSISLRAA